ncbi:MAG: GNAT family N-acetyltransferase [Magnetococcales bacterium]|nr:GNAT family N-acetyltransferase [Magnetococcales bacterium]
MIPGIRAIELITKAHNRSDFNCGKPQLNDYLKTQARYRNKKDITRIFVAVSDDNSNRIVGYYGLTSTSIATSELSDKMIKGLPRYPITCALLARLAVDVSFHNKGLGGVLLAHAWRNVLEVSKKLAIKSMIVDAKDQEAKTFYLHHGFIQLTSGPMRLALSIDDIRKFFR